MTIERQKLSDNEVLILTQDGRILAKVTRWDACPVDIARLCNAVVSEIDKTQIVCRDRQEWQHSQVKLQRRRKQSKLQAASALVRSRLKRAEDELKEKNEQAQKVEAES